MDNPQIAVRLVETLARLKTLGLRALRISRSSIACVSQVGARYPRGIPPSRSSRRTSARLAAVLVIVLALAPSTASAHHGRGIRWAAPLLVKVGDCTQARWRPAVRAAVADWDRTPGLSVRRVRCNRGRFSVRSGYFQRSWAGLASPRSSGGLIQSIEGVSIENRYSRKSIVCHALGLVTGTARSRACTPDRAGGPSPRPRTQRSRRSTGRPERCPSCSRA